MKTVLLTGGSGFIGRHAVAPLIERGFTVHAITSRAGCPAPQDDLIWHSCDLFDGDAVARLTASIRSTHLLHLAWDTTPRKYLHDPGNVAWVQATLALFRRFADAGGRRAVLAGTCAEYDVRYGYCSEILTPLAPRTLYGACKHGLNSIAGAYARQAGMSFAWGRVFYLYGPWEHPSRLVASVAKALLEGRRAPCTEGHQIRDFSHVQDVAGGFVATLDSDVQGDVNIGSGEPLKVRNLVQKLAELAGRPELVDFGAIVPACEEPPMVVADVSRLRREVGWKPEFDLSRGLEQTLQFWRSISKQRKGA